MFVTVAWCAGAYDCAEILNPLLVFADERGLSSAGGSTVNVCAQVWRTRRVGLIPAEDMDEYGILQFHWVFKG